MSKKALAMLLLSAMLGARAGSVPPASNTAQAAQRDLWLADEGRYVRQWLLLGPLSPARADELARPAGSSVLASPAPGAEQRFADNSVVTWRRQGSYGDVLDGFSAAGMKDGDVGLALAIIERDTAGEAELLIGGNVRGVWVNGEWLGGGDNSAAFVIDGHRMKAKLLAGRNEILLRVERLDRPVLLTLRVVPVGFAGGPAGAMAPYIQGNAADVLRIMPGTPAAPPLPQMRYEVLAPGGRVLASSDATRAAPVSFNSTDWPAGPYEVRVTTQNELGQTLTAWLPWYKGDAAAAGRALAAAAAAPGAGAQLRMLGDMVRDRATGDWRDLHSPLMEYEELKLEQAGGAGGAHGGGFIRLSWTDDIDGSTQFCRAYLPAIYPAPAPAPVLIFLHGYNPPNPPYVRWWSSAERHNGVAERHALIVLEPMGRGNVDYRWMGERDVLRCLAEAQRRLAIDADRVYLTGESMGGNGTWLIASRNPQLFAAAAPVYGGWDYRINVNGYAYTNPQATRPMENFIHEAHASFAGAESLLHVPLYVLQGDADTAVPAEQSRHGVQLLQRFGYEVRYREIPGRGHEDLKARDEIADWLLQHRRAVAPEEVRLRSYDLAGARAHWLRVEGWENPFEMIEAHASMLGRNSVRVDTRNVAALTLTAPPRLLDRGVPLKVVWNGSESEAQADQDGSVTLRAAGFPPGKRDKSPQREGRLSYFFGTPFAIVVGTQSSDPALNAGLAAKGAALTDLWEQWQHATPRVFRDTDVTAEIERQYSLLLLGGPQANKVSARLAQRVPLQVTKNSVSVDGRRFAVSDAVAQMLYPSPLNAGRYLLLVAPTSAAGLRYWNPQQYWHALNGFPMNFWDWTIVDGRHVTQASGLFPDRGWIAAGVFDLHWRRDERFTVSGDPELRARATLRHAPAPGFKLPGEVLDALVGRYRVNPGQIGGGGLINVTRAGDSISASAPEGGREWPLEAEDENDFAIAGLGSPVSFLRDGAGAPTGLVYHYNGQEIVASKLP